MQSYLTPGQVTIVEEHADNQRDRLLIRVLFHVGCRVSEALAIEVGHVDFTGRTITIPHLKSRLRLSCPNCRYSLARRHTFCPGCGTKIGDTVAEEEKRRRIRTLPVDDETLTLLREYINRGGPVSKNGKILIFSINRHRAWQIVKECAERAGLPKLVNPETGKVHNISPHRFRDALAVEAIKTDDSGNGLRLLQEHLGHQSINTTMKYRKIASEEHRDWYDKLWQRDTS